MRNQDSATKVKPSLVFVADLESLFWRMLGRNLGRDFHVNSFSSAGKALAFIRTTRKFDVLVTDLNLSHSSRGGCSIAREVRKRFPESLIFIFNNGESEDYRLMLLRNMPGVRILNDPFGAFALTGMILAELKRHRKRNDDR